MSADVYIYHLATILMNSDLKLGAQKPVQFWPLLTILRLSILNDNLVVYASYRCYFIVQNQTRPLKNVVHIWFAVIKLHQLQ